jgi:uncharacterized protein (DUF1800 family)
LICVSFLKASISLHNQRNPLNQIQVTSSANSIQRRSALQCLASVAMVAAGMPSRAKSLETTPRALADSWRAMSRVGYGPSVVLMQDMQAASSPRQWALLQLDLALAASKQPPKLASEWADFNAPLPRIFDGFKAERQARTQLKAEAPKDSDSPQAKRMDFSGPKDPLHFSRMLVLQASAWRLTSCSQPQDENPLLARMTEFWFNHLNVFSGKGAVRPFTGHYVVNVARAHALGKFEDLLLASARHPAMLGYLDQAQSVADGSRGPNGTTRGLNENYARELMELHTLGVDGGYSQTDVREMARVLTGWTLSPNDASGFRFATRLHDGGDKRVLGQTFPQGFSRRGEQEGEDAIRMLARHPATAQRISLRLAQFFVADQPKKELVQQLSRTFTSTQGDIREVVRTLLQSPDFWSAENKLFKTPMDFACSALTATQGAPRTPAERRHLLLTLGFLNNAGQPLFGWQTPDGYKFDAATWLVPEALTRRADFALTLTRQTPELEFLKPFLSTTTLQAIVQEKPNQRAGLVLASPDFMYK